MTREQADAWFAAIGVAVVSVLAGALVFIVICALVWAGTELVHRIRRIRRGRRRCTCSFGG
ncbi:hypothetical protein O4215_20570 [Rhodococcus maanshanensis]|uniref:hypothetical protein n=1 Tax=Rhodococcus maanshanensis TaxID=183556 RepID=UPI0022B5C5CC|nr:hypothetical protein [Rhodococcus maanshanensis]MCZ4557959.1 hypothetical protein [Rhodococcus maanshanensis]